MGLDLHALRKKPSFKEEDLQNLIKDKKHLDAAWDELQIFVNTQIEATHQMDLETFFKCLEGPELDTALDKIFYSPLVNAERERLGIPDPRLEPEVDDCGPTTSEVLNYYFKHCEEYEWTEVPLTLDYSLLKNPEQHEWIPYGPHVSSELNGSVRDLLDEYQILQSSQVEEAIRRVKNRKSIDEKDLRMIAFLEKYSDCVFAFI